MAMCVPTPPVPAGACSAAGAGPDGEHAMTESKSRKARTAKPAKDKAPRVAKARKAEKRPLAEAAPSPATQEAAPVSEQAVSTEQVQVPANDASAEPAVEQTQPKPTKAKKPSKEPTEKRMSGLDACAQVLKDKGELMNCKAMVEAALAK